MKQNKMKKSELAKAADISQYAMKAKLYLWISWLGFAKYFIVILVI